MSNSSDTPTVSQVWRQLHEAANEQGLASAEVVWHLRHSRQMTYEMLVQTWHNCQSTVEQAWMSPTAGLSVVAAVVSKLCYSFVSASGTSTPNVEGLTVPRFCFYAGMGQCKFTQPFATPFGSMYQDRHKICKPFDPVIPLLGSYPKEITLNMDEGLCTKTVTAISFRIGKMETASLRNHRKEY